MLFPRQITLKQSYFPIDQERFLKAMVKQDYESAAIAFSPYIELIHKELCDREGYSPVTIYLIGRMAKGDLNVALAKLKFLPEKEELYSLLHLSMLKAGPVPLGTNKWVCTFLFIRDFNRRLIQGIDRDYKEHVLIGQSIEEADITYEYEEPDVLLIDYLQTQEPWLWHYASLRYLEYTQKEIGEMSHISRRTLIEDEKKLCLLLKKKLSSSSGTRATSRHS